MNKENLIEYINIIEFEENLFEFFDKSINWYNNNGILN